MRQILFKAKRKDWRTLPKEQWWVEGDLLRTKYDDTVLISDFEDQLFRCDGNTLCQYTGLNDNTKWEELTELEKELFLLNWNYQEDRKNKVEDWKGKKIWENDIVRFNKCSNYPVVWNKGYCAFGSCYYSDFDYLSKYRNDEMEVVGNIFDNEDLLEV